MRMENTFKEIAGLLSKGPVKGKEPVFMGILDIVLSCTSENDTRRFFNEEFVSYVLKFGGPNSPYASIIYNILINLFSEEELTDKFCSNKSFMSDIINMSLEDIHNKNSLTADLGCMLLANLTRCQNNCELVSRYFSPQSETLNKIVSIFTSVGYNSTCSLDQLSMLLCNLSQLAEVRSILTQTDHCMLQKLVPFMNHESLVRRRGIIGLVHNCAFDSSVHSFLLSDEVDILPRLLLPLAGPEQFDDEDNDKLPVELQYLPDTKTRESNPEVRKQLMETLNQLCATKFGRQFLRDNNAYIILRELHKWEKDSSALVACENVVDILIRTEDEIGVDHLNTLEIPEDLHEKFKELTS